MKALFLSVIFDRQPFNGGAPSRMAGRLVPVESGV